MTVASRITINDLPAEFEMELPEASTGLAAVLCWIGYMIIAVGVVTMMVGPETIYYNAIRGMTPLQMIQAYPGPIASVGFFLVVMGQFFSSGAQRAHTEEVAATLAQRIDIPDEAIPSGFRLDLAPLGNNRYSLKLVEAMETGVA